MEISPTDKVTLNWLVPYLRHRTPRDITPARDWKGIMATIQYLGNTYDIVDLAPYVEAVAAKHNIT